MLRRRDERGASEASRELRFFTQRCDSPLVPDTLGVDINRRERKSLEAPDAFETDGPFAVELRNHGEATHVYLNLDGALVRAASLGATNHYVEAGSKQSVRVHLDPDAGESVRGQLKVATGYGAETRYVDVNIDRTPERTIEVDPSLSEPRPREDAPGDSLIGLDAIPAVVLGLIAVVLAAGAVVSETSPTNVAFAVLAVVAAVLAVGYFALR